MTVLSFGSTVGVLLSWAVLQSWAFLRVFTVQNVLVVASWVFIAVGAVPFASSGLLGLSMTIAGPGLGTWLALACVWLALRRTKALRDDAGDESEALAKGWSNSGARQLLQPAAHSSQLWSPLGLALGAEALVCTVPLLVLEITLHSQQRNHGNYAQRGATVVILATILALTDSLVVLWAWLYSVHRALTFIYAIEVFNVVSLWLFFVFSVLVGSEAIDDQASINGTASAALHSMAEELDRGSSASSGTGTSSSVDEETPFITHQLFQIAATICVVLATGLLPCK